MKLSKLNMSLENNSAKKEKEISCHDVCAIRHHSPFPSYYFFPLTLLFEVTNVIQKIQGLSLPVFLYRDHLAPRTLSIKAKKKGEMAIGKKGVGG